MECKVCSDANAQHHYGTVCCPSCKGFFRRVYLSAKNLECYRGNCCIINKSSRNGCRACRYKKCLDVGMNVNDIRGRVETNSPSSLPDLPDIKDPRILQAKYEPMSSLSSDVVVDETEVLCNMYSNLDRQVALQQHFHALFQRFCEESTIGNNMDLNDEKALIEKMMNCTVVELLRKSCPQCPRFSRVWKPFEYLNADNFLRSWARDVVNILDWANHFPVFKKLCEKDKKLVFLGRFSQLSYFTKCYRTYRENCSGLLFGCSNVYPLQKPEQINIENANLRRIFDFATTMFFPEVIFPMVYLSLTEQEYVLIKANIFLFEGYTFCELSEDGKNIMRGERARHRAALLSLLSSAESFEDNVHRTIKAESIMSSIEAVCHLIDRELNTMSLESDKRFSAPLLKEIHSGKYNLNINNAHITIPVPKKGTQSIKKEEDHDEHSLST